MKQTPLSQVRNLIRPWDLCAFRAFPQGEIAVAGRSPYSHVAGAVWRVADQRTLSIAEEREGFGSRVISLHGEVKHYPGLIDVYTPTDDCPQILRERAATIGYNWATGAHGYDYEGLAPMALEHLGALRRLLGYLGYHPEYKPSDLSDWERKRVCSVFYGWVWRYARHELLQSPATAGWLLDNDWDPIPHLQEDWFEPADLIHSGSFRLRFEGLTPE